MTQIDIYTDGACSGNPGPGGWGCLLMHGEHTRELSGGVSPTTNNRMELMAAIRGLQALTRPCNVNLYSDSSYLINAFIKGWLTAWQARGWKKADNKPVENQDLWQELLAAAASHQVKWIKVKGHADNPYNNRCDALARGAIEKDKA